MVIEESISSWLRCFLRVLGSDGTRVLLANITSEREKEILEHVLMKRHINISNTNMQESCTSIY
jgi:hypothetical protein